MELLIAVRWNVDDDFAHHSAFNLELRSSQLSLFPFRRDASSWSALNQATVLAMSTPLNLSTYGRDLDDAYKKVLDPKSSIDWVLTGYLGRDTLKVSKMGCMFCYLGAKVDEGRSRRLTFDTSDFRAAPCLVHLVPWKQPDLMTSQTNLVSYRFIIVRVRGGLTRVVCLQATERSNTHSRALSTIFPGSRSSCSSDGVVKVFQTKGCSRNTTQRSSVSLK